MIDARQVDARKPVFQSAIRKPVPFSPFRYLALLLPTPLFAWYWAGEAMHKMELDWLRANPGQAEMLADVCEAGGAAVCELYAPIAFTHWLALALLFFLPKFMLLVASFPAWSQAWQARLLRNAKQLGALGLLITFAMVMTRGVIATLTVWFVPQVWWNNDTIGVQLGAFIGLIAVMRAPPHALAAWRVWRGLHRSRTGKTVTATEVPALWAMIHDACRRLGVAAPDHLVMGVAPDCRLEIGRLRLEPGGQALDGRVLYLGTTLAASLGHERLALLIEHALLRSRGQYGGWLPAAEDWAQASQAYLQECKEVRAGGGMRSAVDPALFCWEGWLITVGKMLQNFKEEHAYLQKKGIEYEVEQAAPEVAELLRQAALAYRKDVFHLFIVNLSSGVHCPSVLPWFVRAFAQRRPADAAANLHAYTNAALETELVLLEKEWLIKTGQATTPNDCWELRAA